MTSSPQEAGAPPKVSAERVAELRFAHEDCPLDGMCDASELLAALTSAEAALASREAEAGAERERQQEKLRELYAYRVQQGIVVAAEGIMDAAHICGFTIRPKDDVDGDL